MTVDSHEVSQAGIKLRRGVEGKWLEGGTISTRSVHVGRGMDSAVPRQRRSRPFLNPRKTGFDLDTVLSAEVPNVRPSEENGVGGEGYTDIYSSDRNTSAVHLCGTDETHGQDIFFNLCLGHITKDGSGNSRVSFLLSERRLMYMLRAAKNAYIHDNQIINKTCST